MVTLGNYCRLEFENTPIYIDPDRPDWFIPTDKADLVLSQLKEAEPISQVVADYAQRWGGEHSYVYHLITTLLSRLNHAHQKEYRGRSHYRSLTSLKECWFHVTNQCNMACSHCLFSSDSKRQPSLPYETLLKAIDEAFSLGCRAFYFTGGEPFLYPAFTKVCDDILGRHDTKVVVLTNGKNIKKFGAWLRAKAKDRVHFQISIDGLQGNHDALRGAGAFQSLLGSLGFLRSCGLPTTLAMTVTRDNVHEMASIVDIAHQFGIGNVHFLWLFRKGKASQRLSVSPETIFPELRKAYEKGQETNILIDNMEMIKSQVFSLPGTKFDLSNAGWESLAVGPDGTVYPSPALIGEPDAAAGDLMTGLEQVWKESPLLEKLRKASLLQDTMNERDPLRYLIGGGDIDHSYIAGKTFVGADPYLDLYNRMALYLMCHEVLGHKQNQTVGMACRMGEHLYQCDEDNASVGFTHSNCVLSLNGGDGHRTVNSFYSEAAESVNPDILNPVKYAESEIAHIPEESRFRSYGCGSPVLDCLLREGEVLVDLGSGTGVECFMGAKKVGSQGRVYGIDMSDAMLGVARRTLAKVAKNLGYRNVEFRKGLLEHIPLEAECADVVTSNCVINLSPDKRRTFAEISRVLKPGGRLCVSDIVCEEPIPLDIAYNEKLRGECIGGAMREQELFGMLEDLGFEGIFVVKRFLYRQIKGHDFFSVTYRAYKPGNQASRSVLYRGPFYAVITDDGEILRRGSKQLIGLPSAVTRNDDLFVLDENGKVTNVEQEITCCCSLPEAEPLPVSKLEEVKHRTGCMVCGNEITYRRDHGAAACYYCGKVIKTNTLCTEGHFVCDHCHARDALGIIRELCSKQTDRDMVSLLKKIRSHASVPLHGPEHHAMIPGIILSVYRNLGGAIAEKDIFVGIERGNTVAGGACSFFGICGAAAGVGIAFSILLGADPYLGRERQTVMKITRDTIDKIAAYEGPRCCQRECWLALKETSRISKRYLSTFLPAQEPMKCQQSWQNKECIGKECPLFSGA